MLTVSLSVMSLSAQYVGQRADDLLNQSSGQQLNRVATAANQYAHDHFESLQSSTSHGESVIWNSSEIKQFLYDGGYLPNTLLDHNPYNQTYRIVIQQPKKSLLQLLVLTQGGQIINESGLRKITQWVGPTGGYVSQQQPNQATGSQGGWQLPFSGSVMTTPGHVAALNYLNANDVLSSSSLLFRKKIDGHPEYNRMETDLKMAADIELEDGSKIWFNQGGNRSTVIKGGSIALTHGGSSLTLTPEMLVANVATGVDGFRAIETNAHISAGGDVYVGRTLTVRKNSVVSGDSSVGNNLLVGNKLKIGDMELTSDSLKFNGVDIRRDADIPEYTLAENSMYVNIWPAVNKHCSVKNQQRRLFLVKDQGYAKHLVMCLGHSNGNPTYWIIATGHYKDAGRYDQGLHLYRPRAYEIPY